ncbi:MAG: hypothetical protein JNM58_06365 [Xanthomonadaceae bacterium]|nr:hypothetical protein [Xanthomonadaceae bacterium]
MTENPYAPPVADTLAPIRRIEWWNRIVMIAVFLVSFAPMLAVVAIYGPLVQLALGRDASFTADSKDWMELLLLTALAITMAAGAFLLVFRRKWSLHLYLIAAALFVFGSAGGLIQPKAAAWAIIATVVVYTYFLSRRSFLH